MTLLKCKLDVCGFLSKFPSRAFHDTESKTYLFLPFSRPCRAWPWPVAPDGLSPLASLSCWRSPPSPHGLHAIHTLSFSGLCFVKASATTVPTASPPVLHYLCPFALSYIEITQLEIISPILHFTWLSPHIFAGLLSWKMIPVYAGVPSALPADIRGQHSAWHAWKMKECLSNSTRAAFQAALEVGPKGTGAGDQGRRCWTGDSKAGCAGQGSGPPSHLLERLRPFSFYLLGFL